MKKNVFPIILILIIILSACMLRGDFDSVYNLAREAVAKGSVLSAFQYSKELKSLCKTAEQHSKADMISGYAHFLSGDYAGALEKFESSQDYGHLNEAISGKILTHFMLNNHDLVNHFCSDLNLIDNLWSFRLNHEEITKARLFELCALSNAISNNRQAFEGVKEHLTDELAYKMEVFFFE